MCPTGCGRALGRHYVACLSPRREDHPLPLEALPAALAERGMPVKMFGAALPVEALVEAVRRTGPAAVGLWAQSRTPADRPLAHHVAALEWAVGGARRHPVVPALGRHGRARGAGPAATSGLSEALTALESVVTR